MVRRIAVLLMLVLIMAGNLPAHAQGIETLEVEGVKHFVRFTRDQSPVFQEATLTMMREIIPSLAAYTGWTVPTIVLHFAPPEDVDGAGDPLSDLHARYIPSSGLMSIALPTDVPAQVCAISAYSVPAGDQYRFLLAVELAQCMMYTNVAAASAGDFDTDLANRWWGEGAAYVLAEMLSGAGDVDWTKAQAAFVANQNQTLMKADTGAYYFWAFALSKLGDSGFLALIDFMPDATEDQYHHLKDKLPPDADGFMHDFAKAVAAGSIAHLPDLETLFHVTIIETLPDRAKLLPEPFAIGFERVNIAGITADGDEGVIFEATELAGSGITVSTLEGEQVIDSTPQEICGSDGKFPFIYSRAAEGDLGDPPPEGNLKYDTLDCAAPEVADTDAGCMVGTWELTGIPQMSGTSIVISNGSRRVTIGADGSVQDVYTNFEMTMIPDNGPAGVVGVQGMITSQIVIGEDGIVTSVSNMRPDVSVVVRVNEQEVDMSSAANEILGDAGSITTGVRLDCMGPTTLLITPVGVSEIAGGFMLMRVGEE